LNEREGFGAEDVGVSGEFEEDDGAVEGGGGFWREFLRFRYT
jgi:hypothetical protein